MVPTGVRLTGSGGLEFEESSKDVLGEGREITDVLQVSKRHMTCHCSQIVLYTCSGRSIKCRAAITPNKQRHWLMASSSMYGFEEASNM